LNRDERKVTRPLKVLWQVQEQQCVAVGPGNAHFISIHQVSHVRAAAAAALLLPPLLLMLLCIGSLMIKS